MEFTVRAVGKDEVRLRFRSLAVTLDNFTPEMREYRNAFSKRVVRQFDTKGGEFKQRWPALSPSTIERKNRKVGSGARKRLSGKSQMLVETGKMFGNFEYESGKDYVKVSNETEYFRFHQLGTSKMPQRLMYRLDREAKKDFIDIVKKGIKRRANL